MIPTIVIKLVMRNLEKIEPCDDDDDGDDDDDAVEEVKRGLPRTTLPGGQNETGC